jgi:hypothetical protein
MVCQLSPRGGSLGRVSYHPSQSNRHQAHHRQGGAEGLRSAPENAPLSGGVLSTSNNNTRTLRGLHQEDAGGGVSEEVSGGLVRVVSREIGMSNGGEG